MTTEERECLGACASLEPVHLWFNLTYANYLVLQRSILQSMPEGWQTRFVQCLEELDEATSDLDLPSMFAVQVRDEDGRFTSDPVPHYNRGRTKVDLRPVDIVHIEKDSLPVMDAEEFVSRIESGAEKLASGAGS